MVPIQMNAIPSRIRNRSTIFAFRFLSLKRITAQIKEMMTELLLTSDTTDIIDSGSLSDEKYAKSAMQMKMDIKGMVHLHLNGVVRCLVGHQISPQMKVMIII